MNKTVAIAVAAASLTAGGIAGLVLGAPALAGAQTAASDAVSWVDEAVTGLVTDGTISQAQADAVVSALEEARPARGDHKRGDPRRGDHMRGGRHVASAAVAEALGVTAEELRAALDEGQTIAGVAQARSVDLQAVVDALVAKNQERLAEAVAAGEITQAEADERLAKAEERAAAMVNGDELDRRGDRPGRRHGRGPRAATGSGTEDPAG